MKKILVILGPTSTGKTDIALKLAEKFNGELVSCDSRQVYKGLDTGTGKHPNLNIKYQISNIKKKEGYWEVNGIRIWMYDVVDPKKQYTVFNYVQEANKAIDGIIKKGKLPIIAGGTGLYLKALLEGLPSLEIPVDFRLRKELEKLSLQELQKRLQKIFPDKWENMNNSDRQNPRRLIRAIEIIQNSKFKTQSSKLQLKTQNYHTLKIGLTAPREILFKRIDRRIISRIKQGMIEEAADLHKNGLTFKRMKQLGLEYGVLADYLQGEIEDKEELIRVLQGKIHGFARRQQTWFRKEKDALWFDISNRDFSKKVEKVVAKWYYQFDDTKDRCFS